MTQSGNHTGLARGFLATEAAGPREKGLARLVIAVSLVGFVVGVPFVQERFAPFPAFIPAYEAAFLVTDLITAVLLFSQFSRLRSLALLLLASGYLYDALMIVPHALSFPGVFSEAGLLGAGPQTTAWLYMLWHLGFVLFVLGYAVIARSDVDTMNAGPTRAIAFACGIVAVLVLALTLLTTAGQDLLPVVMNGSSYSLNVTKGIAPAIWIVMAVVLGVLWWRSVPTVLELWMMVVLVALLLDFAFSAVLGAHRYDFGFYAGRVYGLLASSFVLGTLLVEANRLYGNLGGALALAGQRDAALFRSREKLAQAQRFEAFSQLLAGVAHDFNNLLTVISGGLELALGDLRIAAAPRRSLEASLRAAHRGEQAAQQLLIFSNRQRLRPEVLNANEAIANLQSLIAKAAGEKVQVTTKLSPVLWPAHIDRTQFETALLNLVINARDAMNGAGELTIETGNVTLDAAASADLPAGDYLLTAVSDTGPGMPPDIAAHAFDPFFTTNEAGTGSGIGLTQVNAFARRAQGQAKILTEPGKGTRVEIYLPKSAAVAAPAEDALPLAPLPATAAGETVLVVEDNPDVLDFAVAGLTELGYRVKTATDAQAALDILRTEADIDVLFSDVAMPGGMNGGQLAVEAQRIRPGLRVLLTSGYAASALSQNELPETLRVLPKPYRRDDLAANLRLVIAEGSQPSSSAA